MHKKLAYTSDLHLDFFFKEGSNIPRALDYHFSKYFQELDSDTLVIAGDTSHFTPEYETEVILELKHWLNLKHAIIVNGNHSCVAKGTEVLTEGGWKDAFSISMNDRLAQYDIDTAEISYATPVAFLDTFKEHARVIETSLTKQVVSLDHDVVLGNRKVKAASVEELNDYDIPNSGDYASDGVNISDEMLMLLTWIVMDGTIRKDEGIKCRVQFKLSKPRKIEVLTALLTSMGLPHTVKPATMCTSNILQPYMIRMYSGTARMLWTELGGVKEFPSSWVRLNERQLRIVLSTIEITDGSRQRNDVTWSTISKHNLDVIQTACIHNGIPFRYLADSGAKSGFSTRNSLYTCTFFTEPKQHLYKHSAYTIQYNDYMRAIQMPLGTLVTRIDGKPAITGNCYLLGKQLQNRFSNGLQLAAFRTDLYNQNGIHALEGNFVEIDGIRIGGCDSFYDGTIFYRQLSYSSPYSATGSLERYWKSFMNDSYNMRLDSFSEYAKQQKELLRGLKDQVDVMVTHVKPVVSNKYFPESYRGDKSNAFYSFDFEEEIATDSRLQSWVYGHTHNVEQWDFLGVDLLANPRGYPGEVKDKTIKHLEVTR